MNLVAGLLINFLVGSIVIVLVDKDQRWLAWVDRCPLPGARRLGYMYPVVIQLWFVILYAELYSRRASRSK